MARCQMHCVNKIDLPNLLCLLYTLETSRIQTLKAQKLGYLGGSTDKDSNVDPRI